jgi:hypothetical protein
MYIPVRVYVSSCRRGTEDKGMFTLTEAERAYHKPAARAGAAHLQLLLVNSICAQRSISTQIPHSKQGQHSSVTMLSFWSPNRGER